MINQENATKVEETRGMNHEKCEEKKNLNEKLRTEMRRRKRNKNESQSG
jgi:hypothetical protein